jgi:hypothetical protein
MSLIASVDVALMHHGLRRAILCVDVNDALAWISKIICIYLFAHAARSVFEPMRTAQADRCSAADATFRDRVASIGWRAQLHNS